MKADPSPRSPLLTLAPTPLHVEPTMARPEKYRNTKNAVKYRLFKKICYTGLITRVVDIDGEGGGLSGIKNLVGN